MIRASELLADRGGNDKRLTLSKRIRWALAGVALFVVPTASLTVWALARVHTGSQAQARELALVVELEDAWGRAAQELEDDGVAAVDTLIERIDLLAQGHALHEEALGAARIAAVAVGEALALRRPVTASPPAEGSLLGLFVAQAESVGAELAALPVRGLIRKRVGALASAISAVRAEAAASSVAAATDLGGAVDAANRYLVTLSLAMLVYLTYLFILLPSRLLASFARVRATLRQARTGDLTLRAPTEGDDDAAVLARDFNEMMEVIERFDHRKRQRIFQDSQVVRRLGERVGAPWALLGLDGLIDTANGRFWGLFGQDVPPSGERPHVSDVMGGGSRDFSDLLAQSLGERRAVVAHPVVVEALDGTTQRFALTAEAVRGTDARLTHLLVVLDPLAPDALSTGRPQGAVSPPGTE
ncbi:MAG: hypothetical protein AMXMBFR64_37450 [Myxococcales bacterium]